MTGRIMTPSNAHTLIPKPVNVTLYGKKDSACVRVRNLNWGNYARLSRWA